MNFFSILRLYKKMWCLSNYNSFKPRYDCFYWFSKLTLCIVMAGLRVGRFIDRFSPIQKYAYHDSVLEGYFSLSLHLSLPLFNEWSCIDYASLAHILCILAKRAVITFVLIILSIHLIRRCCRLTGTPSEKNDRWVCDISWSPSRPRPTVLLNSKVLPPYPYPTHSPSSLFPFFPVPGPRRSRSRLSSGRILHPTDHSYESYLVACSTSPGSYEIAEASVVDASEY